MVIKCNVGAIFWRRIVRSGQKDGPRTEKSKGKASAGLERENLIQ
jgi:hypothetical protein